MPACLSGHLSTVSLCELTPVTYAALPIVMDLMAKVQRRCSRGQEGKPAGCIDVAAPWPYVSRGGRAAIQLLAACVHSLTWKQSPAMAKGLHQAPPHSASRQKESPIQVPPLRTWHTALVWHLSPVKQSKHLIFLQREGQAAEKQQKWKAFDFDKPERKYHSLMKWQRSFKILGGCHGSREKSAWSFL